MKGGLLSSWLMVEQSSLPRLKLPGAVSHAGALRRKERTVSQMQPHRVAITTPKGTILVPRPLYKRLEQKLAPDEFGLLRDYDWWTQLGEAITGMSLLLTAPKQRGA